MRRRLSYALGSIATLLVLWALLAPPRPDGAGRAAADAAAQGQSVTLPAAETSVSAPPHPFDPEKIGPIGFFTPEEIEESLHFSDFSILNLHAWGHFSLAKTNLPRALEAIRGSDHRIVINLSLVLFDRQEAGALNVTYPDDPARTKSFAPLPLRKVFRAKDPAIIEPYFERFLDELRPHIASIHSFMLADEPYINGIRKEELETIAGVMKRVLEKKGLEIPLYVNFAGAMFDADFARMVDARLWAHVRRIDDHRLLQEGMLPSLADSERKEFQQWVETFSESRLVSYDQAGNIYTHGGIPRGIDLVSFDFYLSTLLLDEMYDLAPHWFASRGLADACRPFADRPMSEIRRDLDFFQAESGTADEETDRSLLDGLFACRMESTLRLLERELQKGVAADRPRVLLVAESSANAFFERDLSGNLEPEQPYAVVERRALTEVRRYLDFKERHADAFAAGVAFFLYPDTYDRSIDLQLMGAEGMASINALVRDLYRARAGGGRNAAAPK